MSIETGFKRIKKNLFNKGTIPEVCSENIFIPGFCDEGKHHYYNIDFSSSEITQWDIDLQSNIEYLKSIIEGKGVEYTIPWNKKSILSYLNTCFFPHGTSFYKDKLFIQYWSSNIILELSTKNDSFCIHMDKVCPEYVYCSTICINDDKLYYARWNVIDTLTKHDSIKPVEIGYLDLITREFINIDTVNFYDDIHDIALSPDGKNLLLLTFCMNTQSGDYPSDVDDMEKYENRGLKSSRLLIYNLDTKQYTTEEVGNAPAHILFDPDDSAAFYFTENNLGFDDKRICCFGNAALNKYRIDQENRIVYEKKYNGADFFRGTDCRLSYYDGKKLGYCTVYPNQVHLIDLDEMKLYKKLKLDESMNDDFYNGNAFYFPNPNFDKTPYGNHPVHGHPYIYLCNVMNIRIFNYRENRIDSSVFYNMEEPLIGIGHSLSY